MQTRRAIPLILLVTLAAYASAEEPRVTVLTNHVKPRLVMKGCEIAMFDGVEEALRGPLGSSFIEYKPMKVMDAGFGPYYIYHRKYCRPIGEVLGANTYVMVHIELVADIDSQVDSEEEMCADGPINIEAKVYSQVSDREEILFS